MTSPFPTADEHATTAAPGGAVVGRHRPRLAVDVDAANNSSQHSQHSGGDNFADPEEDPEENQDQQPSKASKADAHDSPSRNQSENGSPKQ